MTTEEIMDIVFEYSSEVSDLAHSEAAFAYFGKSKYAYRDKLLAELRAAIEALVADAEQWRKYKARKDAVIAAGMGRNPLRGEEAPDTYAVINTDGQVEYSAEWPEACHDHIKDMQEVDGSNAGRWKVRGIKILKERAK